MKKHFCSKLSIEASTIRLFLNGERLENNQTIRQLNLNPNDVIEAFREVSGGGPPQKKNETYNEDQIIEALNKSSDYEDSEDSFCGNEEAHIPQDTNAEEIAAVTAPSGQEITTNEHFDDDMMASAQAPSCQEFNKNEHFDDEMMEQETEDVNQPKDCSKDEETFTASHCKIIQEDGTIISDETEQFLMNQNDMDLVKENEKKENRLTTMDTSYDSIGEDKSKLKEEENGEKEGENWLDVLRKKLNNEKNVGNTSIHKQLQFYLGLPNLTITEMKIVKSLSERLQMHSDWELEKKSLFPQKKKLPKKRKVTEITENHNRCLRRREDNETGNENPENPEKNKVISENMDPISFSGHKDDCCSDTPKQRKTLFQMFGIVSPFLRHKVPSEGELRRLSLAVHLWAERTHGSVGFLQENRLTERHFRDILVFAGPNSRWKLIPERSVTQYKNIWQNAHHGTEHFHGDPETGFETVSKLHDPSVKFCPFGHCMLNSNLIKLTSGKASIKPTRRTLFKPEMHSKLPLDMETMEGEKHPREEEQQSKFEHQMKSLKNQKKVPKPIQLEPDNKEEPSFSEPKIVKCNQLGCSKAFVTVFGLEQHLKKRHGDVENYKKSKQECPFCGKLTVYIDQHIKSFHKEMKRNDTCEVCKQKIKQDMKKHRSVCIFCPFCGYQNR